MIELKKYIDSYYWSSMNPERSGEILKRQVENDLANSKTKLIAGNVPETEIQAFENKYWEFCSKYLTQSAKVASTGITGRSNFNYRRNEKASGYAENTMKEWLEWTEYKVGKLIKNAIPYVDPKTQADEELALLLEEQRKYKEHNKTAKKNGLPMIPGFRLTSVNNKIKARREKIDKIRKQEALAVSNPVVMVLEKEGLKIFIDNTIDRIVVKHDLKPEASEIAKLKSLGFRWSPTNIQWQAFKNRWNLDRVKEFYNN